LAQVLSDGEPVLSASGSVLSVYAAAMRRAGTVALVLVAVVGFVLAGRTAYVGYGPEPADRVVADQVRFLDSALADGAAADMQQLFPEGTFFTTALTALAEARQPSPDVDTLRGRLAVLDAAGVAGPFGAGLTPEHGIFHAGWTLLLRTEIARASGDPADLADLRTHAGAVAAALGDEAYPQSYPGGRWPCDAVVAAAALARADAVLPDQDWSPTLRSWRTAALRSADPATGLLPHRVDADGTAAEGPRGSSQAIVQAFWPDVAEALDGRPDLTTWRAFTTAFVDRRAGLVGVREFPRGTDGAGDVDSGPLVLGVSASASAAALAAARRVGDVRLASSLDREAELVGLGITWRDRRSYAFGQLPVGDAFLAWARSVPLGPPLPAAGPRTRWPLGVGVPLGSALVAVAGLVGLRRRHRTGGDRISSDPGRRGRCR
jgi:hypothetical protein